MLVSTHVILALGGRGKRVRRSRSFLTTQKVPGYPRMYKILISKKEGKFPLLIQYQSPEGHKNNQIFTSSAHCMRKITTYFDSVVKNTGLERWPRG